MWPVLSMILAVAGVRAEPIRVHPDNSHFYLFRGKPTVLVTSAEHYGAVMNKAFNYVAYLDSLKSYGLNYTRIYPAAFIEPEGTFHPENTLAPRSADLIQLNRDIVGISGATLSVQGARPAAKKTKGRRNGRKR